jgi:HSP20 family protein
MALVRWQPRRDLDLFDSFRRFEDEMDRFFGGSGLMERPAVTVPVDVFEDEREYRVRADLPGMDKKNIEVKMDNGVLTITGNKESEHEEKKESFQLRERVWGTFKRSIQLPTNVDQNRVDAAYRNGVLEITIPKTEEAIPRKIDVKVD